MQPDGKILVGGSAGNVAKIARYTASGQLDAGFGSGGIVSYSASSVALAIQPDGKIVAAGTSGTTGVLQRFNTDGTPDGGVGVQGIATLPLAAVFYLRLAAMPDGR